jgi:hypothetical protein
MSGHLMGCSREVLLGLEPPTPDFLGLAMDSNLYTQLAGLIRKSYAQLESNVDSADRNSSSYAVSYRNVVSDFCKDHPEFVFDEKVMRKYGPF